MTHALVIAEVANGQLGPITAEAVTAARTVADSVTVAVIGADASLVALAGVSRIVTVAIQGTDRDHEQVVAAVSAAIERVQPDLVLAGFTIRTSAVAPVVAHLHDLALITDVVGLSRDLDGTLVATRSIYGGRVHAEVAVTGGLPAFILARPSIWAPAETAAPMTAEAIDATIAPGVVTAVELMMPDGDVDLTRSDVILSIGRGVGGQENIAAFADLARRLGAALGASRPVCDAGWLPTSHQIGQTGVTVKPKVYLAFGVSGALHHIVGMQGADTVVAVNTDREAPVFRFADVGAVADIHEVAEEMRTLI